VKEPKLNGPYPPDAPGRSESFFVRWYKDGERKTKKFTDQTRAKLFHQEKLAEHVGHPFNASMVALQKISVIEDAVLEFAGRDAAKALELEAEITRLKEENARFIQNAAAAAVPASGERQIESLTSDVRLLRTDLAVKLNSVPAAIVLCQLHWCLETKKWGRILDDSHRYIFNTYDEWRETHFQCFSIRTLKRAFKFLEDEKLIISKQPEGRKSRRKYYRLTAEGAKLASSQNLEAKWPIPKGQIAGSIDQSGPFPYSESKSTSNTSTRPQAALVTRSLHRNAEVEKELLRHIADLCGPEEMRNNGAMWRDRAKKEPRALRNAIEDLELRSDNYHLPAVKNAGAMLTAAFERCREQLARSLAHARAER
jgi:hypothetical protein